MNKYIKEVDALVASDELKQRLKKFDKTNKKKNPWYKPLTAVAACFVAVVLVFTAFASVGSYKASDEALNEVVENFGSSNSMNDAVIDETASDSATGTSSIDRKIIKQAEIFVQTKQFSAFSTEINLLISNFEGYVVESRESSNSKGFKNSTLNVRVPSEKLDLFINEIESLGNVTSKAVTSSDITNSYVDTQSRLNSLKTEETALLKLLENSGSLSDILDIQSRLSKIRSEIEALQTTINTYDEQVTYSLVTVYIDEVEREAGNTDTFFGKVKEAFSTSLDNLGEFFQSLGVAILGGSPYIIIVAAVAAIVILIIKKVKK